MIRPLTWVAVAIALTFGAINLGIALYFNERLASELEVIPLVLTEVILMPTTMFIWLRDRISWPFFFCNSVAVFPFAIVLLLRA